MLIDDWQNCYSEGWGDRLTRESYVHPAKGAYKLAERIYQHAVAENWLRPGDTVLDPFGGIGGFAFHAMLAGLNWVGIELEPRFVALGQSNVALWNERYARHLPRWGTARLVQGDSRQLASVVAGAGAIVSSPPFADSLCVGKLSDAMREELRRNGHKPSQSGESAEYGSTSGQLANLPATDAGFNAVVSSPPFSDPGSQPCASQSQAMKDYHAFTRGNGTKLGVHTMQTDGNLAGLPAGDFEAAVDGVISSPPYAATEITQRQDFLGGHGADVPANVPTQDRQNGYGSTLGQLGIAPAADFWTASRTIVSQCYAILRPGGHAIFVVKRFVRNKAIVPFDDQWRQLCEACGFVTLHEHHALLTEDRGAQHTVFGEVEHRQVSRMSFFRRLATKKGSPPVDYETVLCLTK